MIQLYMYFFFFGGGGGGLSRNPASKNEPALYVVVFGVQESSL